MYDRYFHAQSYTDRGRVSICLWYRRTLFLYPIHSKIHHGSTGDYIVFIVVLRFDLLFVAPHHSSNLEIQL